MKHVAAAILLTIAAGCAAPKFATDGPFSRSLKEFRRIDLRPVQVALAPQAAEEQRSGAREFAREFPTAVVHRLHRRGILDRADGPVLVLEARITTYEGVEVPGPADTGPTADARIQVVVTFRDDSGALVGSGSVTSTGAGRTVRYALENAEKGVVSSVTTFLRKAVGRMPEKESDDAWEPEITPSE